MSAVILCDLTSSSVAEQVCTLKSTLPAMVLHHYIWSVSQLSTELVFERPPWLMEDFSQQFDLSMSLYDDRSNEGNAAGDQQLGCSPFTQENRQALRTLSRSTPAMNEIESLTVTRSQRKFLRRFKGLNSQEHIIKSYSCALVSDILLHGRLYVTDHHFAFYSNLFGHVTRILIPCSEVVDIIKEKTARFIPNAVAVYSHQGRHVFGSLLSRDSTFACMQLMWRKNTVVGDSESPEMTNFDDGKEVEDVSDAEGTMGTTSIVFKTLTDTSEENEEVIKESTPVTHTAPTHAERKMNIVRSATSSAVDFGTCISTAQQLFSWLISAASSLLMAARSVRGGGGQRISSLLLLCNVLMTVMFGATLVTINRVEQMHWKLAQAAHMPPLRPPPHAPPQSSTPPLQHFNVNDLNQNMDKLLQHHIEELGKVRASLESLTSLPSPQFNHQDISVDIGSARR